MEIVREEKSEVGVLKADASDLPELTDADRYGIVIISSIVFKGAAPKPGHVFFIATWTKWQSNKGARVCYKVEEPYQVSRENIKSYGRDLCEQSVIQQVVARHFTPGK